MYAVHSSDTTTVSSRPVSINTGRSHPLATGTEAHTTKQRIAPCMSHIGKLPTVDHQSLVDLKHDIREAAATLPPDQIRLAGIWLQHCHTFGLLDEKTIQAGLLSKHPNLKTRTLINQGLTELEIRVNNEVTALVGESEDSLFDFADIGLDYSEDENTPLLYVQATLTVIFVHNNLHKLPKVIKNALLESFYHISTHFLPSLSPNETILDDFLMWGENELIEEYELLKKLDVEHEFEKFSNTSDTDECSNHYMNHFIAGEINEDEFNRLVERCNLLIQLKTLYRSRRTDMKRFKQTIAYLDNQYPSHPCVEVMKTILSLIDQHSIDYQKYDYLQDDYHGYSLGYSFFSVGCTDDEIHIVEEYANHRMNCGESGIDRIDLRRVASEDIYVMIKAYSIGFALLRKIETVLN